MPLRFLPFLFALPLAVSAIACGSAPPPVAPCSLAAAAQVGGSAPTPTEDHWRSLLLHSMDDGLAACEGGLVTPDAIQCGGQWQPTAEPEIRLARRVDAQWHIVWIVTSESTDGEAYGPLALVAQTGTGLHVRAIGHVRGPSTVPSVQRVRVDGRRIWVLSGGRCLEGTETDACPRDAWLYELRGQRLEPLPWARDAGEAHVCAARINLETHRDLGARQAQATAVIEPSHGGLTLVEHLAVRDEGASEGEARTVHEVSARRRLAVRPEGLVSTQPPLVDRALADLTASESP